MQLNLFVCNAERNRVDKTDFIQNRYMCAGELKKATSVKTLEIEIERSNFIPYQYNYAYIEDFRRWYFIDDIISVANNRWIVKASVDVLYSYLKDISNFVAIVDKCEEEPNANVYLNDGSLVMDTRKYNELIEFPSGLNSNGSYILICAGGA